MAADVSPIAGEVIVTAQKKSENIQDVPLSVTSVSASELQSLHITDLSELQSLAPGLQVFSQTGQPGAAGVELRGISTGNLNSSTVAILIDDVPVGSSSAEANAGEIGVDLLPYDLDHIEILEGPQGTLYGASSLGGLVKYVTPTPNLDHYQFRIGAEIYGIDHSGGMGSAERASADLPLIPGVLAVDASLGQTYRPGYIDDVALGQKDFNHGKQDEGRLSLLWKPTDHLSVQLVALSNVSNFNGVATVLYDPQAGQPIYGDYQTSSLEPYGSKTRTNFYSARINYNLDWATLTSITGYSQARFSERYDLSSEVAFLGVVAPGSSRVSTDKLTQELRLAAPTGQRLQWLIGGYYTKENSADSEDDRAIDPVSRLPVAVLDPLFTDTAPTRLQEEAVFVNASYAITPAWDFGAGVRYATNQQKVQGTASGFVEGGSVVVSPVSFSDDAVTFSVDTRYHFTPDAMVYGRIASGYTPGGTNVGIVGPDVPATFTPDTLTSYEVGVKSQFFERRLLFNLTGFYIDWVDIQIPETTSLGLGYTGNGGAATSKGLELSTAYSITSGFRVGLHGAYTDASLNDDAPGLGALKGDPLPYSPKLSGALTADWTHPLIDDYRLELGGAWRYVGGRNTSFPNALNNQAHFGAYDALDLKGAIDNDRWRFGLYVKNLANRRAFLSYSVYGAQLLQPLTVGISIDAKFH